MFCVAICDDEEVICNQIEKYLSIYVEQGKIKTEVYYSCEKLYEDLLSGIYYDLIFLDIELKHMNGIDLGNKIRSYLGNQRTQIVYISVAEKYAMELFQVRPLNFLVKPIDERNVIDNLKTAIKLSEMNGGCYEFQTGSSLFRIPFHEIIFFESCGRKVILNTQYTTYEIYKKLDDIEKEVPITFVRIHKSYLVNEIYVKTLTNEQITLNDGTELSISRSYRKLVRQVLFGE